MLKSRNLPFGNVFIDFENKIIQHNYFDWCLFHLFRTSNLFAAILCLPMCYHNSLHKAINRPTTFRTDIGHSRVGHLT